MISKVVAHHCFVFNKNSNGGESVSLDTDFWESEVGDISTTHSFSLQSYLNSAQITFGGQITPELLRQLADELEAMKNTLVQIRKLKNDLSSS
jgi:hypothetical protein